MLEAERWAEIRYLARSGMKIRQISRQLGVDRTTVRRALRSTSCPGVARRRGKPRGSILDPHKPLIAHYLDEAPELSAVQIHDRLKREAGYQGEVTLVRNWLRTLRRQDRDAFLRLCHIPGKVAQVDWAYCGTVKIGQSLRRLSLFVMVLAYSRYLYAEFTLSERIDAFLEAHQRAFLAFGGVPDRLVYDNCKTVTLERQGATVRLHPRLHEFADHYGYTPRTCLPRHPWHKGIVEAAIRYFKKNFLAGRPRPADLDRERADLAVWLSDTANVRDHRETRRRPCDLLAEVERAALRPIVATPYDPALIETVSANRFFEVRFDGNRYTVPFSFAYRTDLLLRASTREVVIFADTKEIARHVRSYERGRRIEDPAHARGLAERRRRAERDTRLTRLVALLGERADEYVRGLTQAEIRAENHIRRILRLADQYGEVEVRAALEQALAGRAFGADTVENIVHQQRRARGAPPLLPVQVADDLEIHVPEPDLSSYECLLTQAERK